jgi:hypothetical protein
MAGASQERAARLLLLDPTPTFAEYDTVAAAASAASSDGVVFREFGFAGGAAATSELDWKSSPTASWPVDQPTPTVITITSPPPNGEVLLPFTVTGTCTPPGQLVKLTNQSTGSLLGTVISDLTTGNWSMLVTSL